MSVSWIDLRVSYTTKREVVDATSVNQFKNRLYKFWLRYGCWPGVCSCSVYMHTEKPIINNKYIVATAYLVRHKE